MCVLSFVFPKCFGANTVDDMGAGQLGLEDTENRGMSLATTGDALELVEFGTGRVNGWVFAMFDHNCVLFQDASFKWCVPSDWDVSCMLVIPRFYHTFARQSSIHFWRLYRRELESDEKIPYTANPR